MKLSPRTFSAPAAGPSPHADPYLADRSTLKLAQFFDTKGLAAIKQEDAHEQWYADWIAYQAEHRIYASVLSSRQFSSLGGGGFDVLRWARFLEVFAYYSPAHGYSAQVTFLGLFSILMGSNAALKREAVAALEAGGLLAFGVSEKTHGSDLLANEFTMRETAPGRYVAGGRKYYIGNVNVAAMIAVLANRPGSRIPLSLIALRPRQASGYGNVRKIRTLGVRAAFVGEFEVRDHEFTDADVIADARRAWDAVLGTVTLGKFFLGFGSIGICEHALAEAAEHLRTRTLYGKPAIDMPHLRRATAQCYARLTAMKLYAFRALDYVHAAADDDRRYLLFCAVQKAKVSTEGVKVMHLLSECIGAKGFEADTYFEMALRDAQLIPGLESSAHINLGLTAQFLGRYFDRFEDALADPPSLVAGEIESRENPYLTEARGGSINTIGFPPYLAAYRPLKSIANVRRFARQVRRLRRLLRAGREKFNDAADVQLSQSLGQCLAIVVYAQLIAENAHRLDVEAQMVSTIFELLIGDLSAAALSLAALPQVASEQRRGLLRMTTIPRTSQADWDFVSTQLDAL